MKIAVLGDIHSNSYALDACLKDINKRHSNVDKFVLLGDNLTDCPNARETINILKSLNNDYECDFIKGNREEYLLDIYDGKIERSFCSSRGSICYTLDLLDESDIKFMRKMPISMQMNFEKLPSITFCHGSPTSTTEHVYPNNDLLDKAFSLVKSKIIISGHNHRKSYINENGFIYANPDAVSFVNGKANLTRYLLLESIDNEFQVKFYDVEYDNKQLLSDFKNSGIYEKGFIYSIAMKKSIETGIDYVYKCAMLAHKIAREKGEVIKKISLPEQYWQEAAKRIKLV